MISHEEAQRYVLDRVRTLSTVEVDLEFAVGSVAAIEVVAEEAVPPFANSAMDGYAVRSSDTSDAPVDLAVVGTLTAGHATDQVIGADEALRIMTGAPLPAGADAVVLLERTQTTGSTVTVQIVVSPGTSVRTTGEDVRPGDRIVASGTILTPSHLALLASVGVNRVTTFRKPRVGVLSTGDELVNNGALRPGKIRNANGPALRGLVRELGFETVDLGVVTDDEDELTETIERAVATCDAVVTTGGVSVGRRARRPGVRSARQSSVGNSVLRTFRAAGTVAHGRSQRHQSAGGSRHCRRRAASRARRKDPLFVGGSAPG